MIYISDLDIGYKRKTAFHYSSIVRILKEREVPYKNRFLSSIRSSVSTCYLGWDTWEEGEILKELNLI